MTIVLQSGRNEGDTTASYERGRENFIRQFPMEVARGSPKEQLSILGRLTQPLQTIQTLARLCHFTTGISRISENHRRISSLIAGVSLSTLAPLLRRVRYPRAGGWEKNSEVLSASEDCRATG